MFTNIIRKLPAWAEFVLILLVCSWWGIYTSIVEIVQQTSRSSNQAQPALVGIGVELGTKENKLVILQAVPDSPAAAAGLSRGWIIQKIDGTNTDGRTPADCADMLRGPAGGKLKLELIDPVQRTNTVELIRREIRGSARPHATNVGLLIVTGLELIGLAMMFWIARVRSWPLAAWGFQPSWKLTGVGILLWPVMMLVITGISMMANSISPGIVHKHLIADTSLPVVIFFSMTNGVFEETLESGYFIQSLQRHGMWVAVLASAIFRTFLHAYHGIAAPIVIFPFGLIFGFIYWKWRRLWPLFVAHMLIDVVAFFVDS